MKYRKLLLAAFLAAPAIAVAQTTPAQSHPDAKAAFGVLQANVAKITAPMEKDRWQANRDAWQVEVSKAGKLQKIEVGEIMASLERMKANIAKIRAGSERSAGRRTSTCGSCT